jgi:hypothetical protein
MLASSVVIVVSDTSDAAEGVHPAYDTLSDKQKKAYDSLLSGVASYRAKIAVSGLTLSQAEEVRDAFCSDHPEFHWFKYSYSIYYYKATGMASEFRSDSLDKAKIQSQTKELEAIVSGFTPSGTTNADRVRSIHDWIILRTSYDLTTENSGNVYGALVEGKARCEGYAYALNYLCLKNGIPSLYLSGTVKGYDAGHAWNILKMDGSRWYYMDVTWDDPKCPVDIEYDYFLIGSSTDTPYGSFADSRKVDNDYGIKASTSAYAYDPYPDGRKSTSISLDEPSARSNAWKTGDWYYRMLDCRLFYESHAMRSIADALKAGNAEYWSIWIRESPSEGYQDTEDPMDIEVRMFLDDQEVTPASLGIQGGLRLELPGSFSPLKSIRIYDAEGSVVSEKNEIGISESGVFTRVVTDFDITEHPIIILVLILLMALLLMLIIRGRIRAHRARTGYRNPVDARVCRQCGYLIPKDSDFCPRCGNMVPKR